MLHDRCLSFFNVVLIILRWHTKHAQFWFVIQFLLRQTKDKQSYTFSGGWHFLRKGVPNLQKVGVDKTAIPPILATKILWLPHHRYTLPPKQAKIVLKSVFLNKINTLSVVILWLPTFWSSNILWPPYFSFQKFMTPGIFGTLPFWRKCQPPYFIQMF